jgi:hypothetical protein
MNLFLNYNDGNYDEDNKSLCYYLLSFSFSLILIFFHYYFVFLRNGY